MEERIPRQTMVPSCYGCGMENPEGLKLEFFKLAADQVRTICKMRKDQCGWPGVVHGGFVAMLLDETACWAVTACTGWRTVVTAELNIKLLKPVPTEREITVLARLKERRDRVFLLDAQVNNDHGEVCATASVTCVEIDAQRFIGDNNSES